MKKLFLGMAVLAIGGGYAATADDQVGSAADEMIAVRQATMAYQASLISDIMRAIGTDAEIGQFEAAGDAIAEWSARLPDLFPPGTENGHHTRALPAIWSDRAGFERAAADLTKAAETMAKAAAAGDRPAFIKSASVTNLACARCHFTYRFGLN
jgi:cytochrome c556